MSKRPRRPYSPEEKAKILRLHLLEQVPISEICEKQGILFLYSDGYGQRDSRAKAF
jgi:transposase-like protein